MEGVERGRGREMVRDIERERERERERWRGQQSGSSRKHSWHLVVGLGLLAWYLSQDCCDNKGSDA